MFSPTKLKEKRESQGLSQSQLASSLGISRASYFNWESGKTKPNQNNLSKLSEILNVDPRYFESEYEIVETYLKLTERNQEATLHYATELLNKQNAKVVEIPERFAYKVYEKLSAGTGTAYFDDGNYDTVYFNHQFDYDFASWVFGNSMEPTYEDGSVALIKQTGSEAAFLPSDIDFEKGILHIDKALQYHCLKVEQFHFDTTKTLNSIREVALPEAASEAIKRTIQRNKEFDAYMEKHPCPAFTHSESVFRTEYGSPITSSTFRQILKRIEGKLLTNCLSDYGFKWVKHVTPHSFRHMHISYLQSNEMHIAVKDIMTRVGHANFETTMGYTHNINRSQENTVKALNQFVENHNFHFEELKSYTCKYSRIIEKFIETSDNSNKVELSVDEFKDLLHLSPRYSPKNIISNLLLKIKKDIVKYHPQFDIKIVKSSENQIRGFSIAW